MQKAKLTGRIPQDVLDNFRRNAEEKNTTMTSLMEPYLVTRNLSDYQPPSWPGYKADGFPGSSLILDSPSPRISGDSLSILTGRSVNCAIVMHLAQLQQIITRTQQEGPENSNFSTSERLYAYPDQLIG